MTFKTIISGRLEFGTPRSYEQVIKMFDHRKENYYKNDILLNGEDIFLMDEYALEVPRFITQSTVRCLQNTVNLLKQVAQFAVAGDMNAWMVDEGKVIKQLHIEPHCDKTAVKAFLKGRDLVNEVGMENEAREALSRAIDKFERHALAYERRGYVNFRLRNYGDALYDYNKSIDINPRKADPYFGRAFVRIAQSDHAAAIIDFESAVKHSIPLQAIYWKARRLKADCLIHIEKYELAIKELNLFLKRNFKPDNSNYKWRKKTYFTLGKALFEIGNYKDAVAAFDNALKTESTKELVAESEILLQRGIALKKAGLDGSTENFKAAAVRGSKKAAKQLKEQV
ncbi:MAG: hypothetical protein DHS20C18_27040 [Saprospiraceae bacterium]|nr:MAG: hypothetical protein DHS20C18_27040 [Saprospiraceae bacterium]